MTTSTIWVLFHDNGEDPNDNVLLAWWPFKPSIDVLAAAVEKSFPCDTDGNTLSLCHLWAAVEQQNWHRLDTVDYRLAELEPGPVDE